MRWSCLLLSLICVCSYSEAAELDEWKLWPGKVPGEPSVDREQVLKTKGPDTEERIHFVDDPTLTLLPAPADRHNGTALIICPGGGYNILAWPKEGLEVGRYFNSHGVTALVLKYRVPRRDPDQPHAAPLQDAQRAIRLVRQRAEELKIDPERVGILGFSAGGNLAVMAGTRWQQATYPAVDDADKLSSRPDFLVPIYAAYLGDPEDDTRLGPQIRLNKQTPPTFLAVTQDDKNRGAHAALMFARLTQLGVPAEVHVYTRGGHGYGIRPSDNPVSSWHVRCAEWMKSQGLLEPSK